MLATKMKERAESMESDRGTNSEPKWPVISPILVLLQMHCFRQYFQGI